MLGNKWNRFSLIVGLVCMGWMLAACDPAEDLNAQNAKLAGGQDLDGDGLPDGRPGPGGGDGAMGGREHPCDAILRALDQATGEEDIIRVLNSYDACLISHQPPPPRHDGHGDGDGGGFCAPPADMVARCEEILKPLHDDPGLPPEAGEQLKHEFEACMIQAHQDCGCPPPKPPGEVCYEIPSDPAACEGILAPLHEGQEVTAEEAEQLRLAFEDCLQSQPTEVVCDPPPPPRDCNLIPADPAACEPIKDALGRATDPAEIEMLTHELDRCLERTSQEQLVCPPPEGGGCHQVPEDPAACEPILEPLKDNPELPPEEAQALFQAFDDCMQSQPTIEVCLPQPPPDGEPLPPPDGETPPPPDGETP